MMKKAAVICAQGIGDGLLMMIAARAFKQAGYSVTIFHNQPKEFSLLFTSYHFISPPLDESLEKTLKPFDTVLVQNDHSKRAWALFSLRKDKKLSNLTFFLPNPCSEKTDKDILFDPKKSVASNIEAGCNKLFNLKNVSKKNDLLFFNKKRHRIFSKRIVIHPTSNNIKKNWPPNKYLQLAKKLKKRGFVVVFTLSPKEREEWLYIEKEGFEIPLFNSLKEMALYLHESGFLIGNDSGVGHLASNLNIPTLTISGNPKQIRLWRPDFSRGKVVTLSFPLPNFKGICLPIREKFWGHFISIKKTLKMFYKLQEES